MDLNLELPTNPTGVASASAEQVHVVFCMCVYTNILIYTRVPHIDISQYARQSSYLVKGLKLHIGREGGVSETITYKETVHNQSLYVI